LTTLLVLLLAYTLSQFYRTFLAIVAGDLSRDLGLNAADLGNMSGIWFLAFALAQFPVGWCLDVVGPRRTLAGFLLLAVAGAFALALADSRAACLLAMALIGLGCSPVLMASMYIFGRTHPPERFALMSSLVLGFGSAGNLLGATPLALAAEAVGWRAAIAGIAGVTALTAGIVFVLLRDPPRLVGAGASGTLLGGLREVAKLRALWPLLPLTFVSYAVVIADRSLWIAPFFGNVHGFGVTERGNAALLMAAAMTLGGLAFGPLERLVGDPKRTTLLGCLVTSAAFLTLGLAGDLSAALALASFGVIGLAGMSYAILMAHGRLFFPAHLLGRGVTFMNFAFIAGAGLLQPVSGALVQAAQERGTPPDEIFANLHLSFAAMLILTTAIYVFAPARPALKPRPVPAP
jgi:MFS family permease